MDANLVTYCIICGTRSIGNFDTLDHAREFAEETTGSTVTLWDSAGSYYGTWHSKEGWIH